jgi:hypothetical protein
MRRREFLLHLSAVVPAAALTAWSRRLKATEAPVPPAWRTFELVTSVEVAAPSGHTQLWLPIPVSASSEYQRLVTTNWDAPGAAHAELAIIPGYDVQLLHVDWSDRRAVGPVTLTNRVATCDRRVSLDVRPPSAGRGRGIGKHAQELSASDNALADRWNRARHGATRLRRPLR